MNTLRFTRLDLRSPLKYQKTAPFDPFAANSGEKEFLVHFKLDTVQALLIEPDAAAVYLAHIVETGTDSSAAGQTDQESNILLPAGIYMFAQVREVCDKHSFLELAFEVQKEALWQGHTLSADLYLRRLYEGEGPVTQLFRPVSDHD